MSFSEIGKAFSELFNKKKNLKKKIENNYESDYYLDEKGNKITNKGLNYELKQKKLNDFLKDLSRSDKDINESRKKYLNKLISNKKKYSFQIEKEYYENKRKERIKKILEQRKKNYSLIFSPNYNTIFPSIHVTVFPKFERINKNKSQSNLINDKKNDLLSTSTKSFTITKNTVKNNQLYNQKNSIEINQNKVKIKKIKFQNLNFNKTINENKNFMTKSFEKKTHNSRIIKKSKSTEIFFGKKVSLKFRPLEALINYCPKYDFIRVDTKKTFVHYGRDLEKDLKNKKIKMTKKKIFGADILNTISDQYEVINICNEEKLKKEKNKQNVYLKYINLIENQLK